MSKIKHLFFGVLFALLINPFVVQKSAERQYVATSAWTGPQTSTEGNYYASVGSETGAALTSKLKSIISVGTSESYDWSRYEAADEAEGVSDSVLLIYSRQVVKKTSNGSANTNWNREHTYPQSKIGAQAKSDNHHIFADNVKTNSARGNKIFNELNKSSSTRVTDGYGNITDNYTNSSEFMPNDAAKGEVARATMYLNTRYGYPVTGNFKSIALMLRWHLENPVSNREIYRNNTVHHLQGNRNPFIDHPEYACRIWSETNTETRSLCAGQAEVDVESVSVTPTSGTINLLGANKSLQLVGKVLPTNATNQTLTWQSSNPSVATVSNTGNVSALSVGETTITVRSAADNTKFATATISVISEPIAVTGVTLNKTTLALQEGETSNLVATVQPSTATNKNVTWSTSNSSVATVDDGNVKAVAFGTATITVTTEDGNKTASAEVSVRKAPEIIGKATKFKFNSKEWTAMPNNWQSITNAWGFDGTRGMQVTGNNEAVGNSPYFENIVKVIVGTSSSSTGAGTYSARLVDSKTALKGEGAQIDEVISVNKPGASIIEREFNLETPTSGHVQLIVEATVNSIYISHVTIVTYVEDPHADALAWGTSFLALTSDGCAQSSKTLLENVWGEAKTSYLALSDEAKVIVKEKDLDAKGDDLSHAKARYILLVSKYGFENFIERNVGSEQRNNALSVDARYALPLILFSIVISGTLITTLVLKKKKR